MKSSWILLVALSLIILMRFTNAQESDINEVGEDVDYPFYDDEGTSEAPETLSPHVDTTTEEPFVGDPEYETSGENTFPSLPPNQQFGDATPTPVDGDIDDSDEEVFYTTSTVRSTKRPAMHQPTPFPVDGDIDDSDEEVFHTTSTVRSTRGPVVNRPTTPVFGDIDDSGEDAFYSSSTVRSTQRPAVNRPTPFPVLGDIDDSDYEPFHSNARPAKNPSIHKPRPDYDEFVRPFPPPSDFLESFNDPFTLSHPDVWANIFDTKFPSRTPSIFGFPQDTPLENHLRFPTETVVQFANLRKDIRKKVRALQDRSNEIDTRITQLIEGSISDINRNIQKNKELIKAETDKWIIEVRQVRQFIQDQISLLKEQVAVTKSNLQKLGQVVEANKASQKSTLQNYGAAVNGGFQKMKEELHNQFVMIEKLHKINSDGP